METTIISVDKDVDSKNIYTQAVDTLEKEDVVAFPTETVYGLGALATSEKAVRKIFEAKGRPSDNPLIVHIGTKEEVAYYAENITNAAEKLMDAFWPGPLTLVFHKKPGNIAPSVTPGVETIGIRIPNHPVALNLLQQLQKPLAAPSANRSGKPSPTEAMHVKKDLDGRIPLVLDGGKTGIGLESTVVDMTSEPPVILRPGGVTKEMIEEVIGPVRLTERSAEEESAPRSPGMKYTHYAPIAPLYVIEPNASTIGEAIQSLQKDHHKVAVIGPHELYNEQADWYFATGALNNVEMMAMNLYDALRRCDETDSTIILAVETDLAGVGSAVMNRLSKAADGKRYTD